MRYSLSRIRLLIALSMLVTATFTAGTGTAGTVPGSKIDPGVMVALAAGENPVNVIVLGQNHTGLSADAFSSRAQAKAALEAQARPFFDSIGRVVAETGGEVLEQWGTAPAVRVLATPETLRRLDAMDPVTDIAHDSPDAVRLVDPTPGADIAPLNTGGRQMIQAEDIWALGFRGEGVKVSIIDTGLDRNHEAFKFADGSSRIVAWKDWVGSQPLPYDDYGHGTHAGATAVGSALYNDPTFGAFQEEGVAPRAIVLGTKFLDSNGGGSFANALNSLQWSYDNGAHITSNSWGASGASGCNASSSVIQLVANLRALGMLSVFAAGNTPGAGTVGGPACGEAALSVGAIDQNKVIASFSSRGPCADPTTGTGSRLCPDVVAKGVNVRSAAPRGTCTLCHSSGYLNLNGTSMATPHVAGAAALIEQMKIFYSGTPWDTANGAEEEVFKLTSLDLGTPAEDNTYGWGLPQLLNIYALLNASDDAQIIDTFAITKSVIRQGDSTTMSFGVRNLGGAIATGPFTATLTDPNGGVTTIKSTTPSLGLLDGESATHTLTVGGSVIPGDYTYRGTFNYTWVDQNNQTQTGSVLREGVVKVARVYIDMTVAGLASPALPILPNAVTFTATNTGNEDAGNVKIEVTVPDDYLFLPGANFDPTNLNSRYSNPAPSSVVEDRTFGRVTLVFNVGTLAQGQSFSFTATMLPTLPGTYRTLSVAKFTDGAGKGFSQGTTTVQEVGIPA